MKNERCKSYCGSACVDGSCPMANRDEYAERGYDIVKSCNDCPCYEGCEDCAFDGMHLCPKIKEKSEGEGTNVLTEESEKDDG